MANTTLSDITFNGDGLTFIGNNNARKEAILTPMPMYLKDSDGTEVFDFGGTIKTLTLDGAHVNTSIAKCKTWIDSVEALINGSQDITNGYPIALIDDYRGNIKVKVMDFESNNVMGEPLIIRWTLKLIQAADTA